MMIVKEQSARELLGRAVVSCLGNGVPGYEGDFLDCFGGCGAEDVLPIPSVNGEYGAAIA